MDGRGGLGPHTMVVSIEVSGGHTGAGSRRRPGLLGTRLHGAGPLSAPGGHILQAGGRHGPPVFTVAGVWPGGGSGQSPLGLWEGTSLGPGSAYLQEGPPTLGGSAQPLVRAGRRGPRARVCAHVKSQGGARCPGLRAPPRPRGPQSKQGLHRWSLPAGGRDSTPGVDAGLVSGEGDPPRPTLAAGLSLGLRDTATAPAPRPPLSAGTPRTQHPDLS